MWICFIVIYSNMRLNSIKLSNFRNFREYQITLGAETTVFIGKNGAGKTNLLASMVKALSFIFSKQRGKAQYKFIASSDQSVKGYRPLDARYALNNEGIYDYIYPINIEVYGHIENGPELFWQFTQETNKSGLKDSRYHAAYNEFWKYYSIRSEKPVLAYFSDSFPHIKTNIGSRMNELLKSGNPLPDNAGYYKWDEELNCVDIWKRYFSTIWINNRLNTSQNNDDYLSAIISKMIDFSGNISEFSTDYDMLINDIEVELKDDVKTIYFLFENNKRIDFESLPQGYKRIFSIVFDIANRSFLLNQHCNPEGVVFIDEIELHLHPSVAREILQRLRRTFPRMQFIVTTHSPLVITNFRQNENNRLFKLFYDDNMNDYKYNLIPDAFGIDYNSGLTDIMDTPHSDEKLRMLKDAYMYWKRKDIDKAQKIADIIRAEFSNESVLVQLLDL